VYEDEQPVETPAANMADLRAALAQLPPELREQIRHAVTLCDMVIVDRVIRDVRIYQPAAADMLTELANAFRYDKILSAL